MEKGFSLSPKKSKRVNWVPSSLLCQVKMFMADDSPSKIGSKGDKFFQTKTSLIHKSDEMGFDGAPPGFGSEGSSETLKQTCVPIIKWKPPPKFILNNNWLVAAGERSEETRTQNYRETRVLEAVYPHPSSIPSSPSISPDSEEYVYDDTKTPLIPVIPIEEDNTIDCEPPSIPQPICSNSIEMNQNEVPLKLSQHNSRNETINEKSGGNSIGLDADIHAAALAVFTAIMKSNERGSLIDTDLLVKILSDPKMIEKLSKDPGFSSSKITPEQKLERLVQCPRIVPENLVNMSSNMKSNENGNLIDTDLLIKIINDPTLIEQLSKDSGVSLTKNKIMPQKPMFASSNMQNQARPTIQFGSSTFSRTLENQSPNLPVFNSNLRYENTNHLSDSEPSLNVSFSVSTPIFTFDFPDNNKNTPMQVISSTSTSVSSSGSKTSFPPTLHTSLSDTINPKRPLNGPEFPQLVPSTSSSYFSRLHGISSNFSTQAFQPSLPFNSIAISPNSGNSRSEMILPSFKENNSFLQYSSSPLDRPLYSLSSENIPVIKGKSYLYPISSENTPVIKDKNYLYPISSENTPVIKDKSYLKTLIELHGVEREVSQGDYVEQYRPKVSEFIRDFGEETNVKVSKQCRYFNSSQGCRNGPKCPFKHDLSIKMQAGSLPYGYSSKRIKLSREIS